MNASAMPDRKSIFRVSRYAPHQTPHMMTERCTPCSKPLSSAKVSATRNTTTEVARSPTPNAPSVHQQHAASSATCRPLIARKCIVPVSRNVRR